MADLEKNKALAKDFLAAMSARDSDKLMDLLADDLEYWVPGTLPLSGTHGKEQLRGMMGGVGDFFPEGLKVRPVSTIAEGNRVAVEAEGGGKTVTGKVYDNRYHFLFEFDEAGKISKLREYMDTGHAADIFSA